MSKKLEICIVCGIIIRDDRYDYRLRIPHIHTTEDADAIFDDITIHPAICAYHEGSFMRTLSHLNDPKHKEHHVIGSWNFGEEWSPDKLKHAKEVTDYVIAVLNYEKGLPSTNIAISERGKEPVDWTELIKNGYAHLSKPDLLRGLKDELKEYEEAKRPNEFADIIGYYKSLNPDAIVPDEAYHAIKYKFDNRRKVYSENNITVPGFKNPQKLGVKDFDKEKEADKADQIFANANNFGSLLNEIKEFVMNQESKPKIEEDTTKKEEVAVTEEANKARKAANLPMLCPKCKGEMKEHYHSPDGGKDVICLKCSGRTQEQFHDDQSKSDPAHQKPNSMHADWPKEIPWPGTVPGQSIDHCKSEVDGTPPEAKLKENKDAIVQPPSSKDLEEQAKTPQAIEKDTNVPIYPESLPEKVQDIIEGAEPEGFRPPWKKPKSKETYFDRKGKHYGK